jgi:hypothetical protein
MVLIQHKDRWIKIQEVIYKDLNKILLKDNLLSNKDLMITQFMHRNKSPEKLN